MTKTPTPEEDSGTGDSIVPRPRADVESVDTATLPVAALPSQAPPKPAQALAFLSILIGGLCGALIGYGYTDVECVGDCSTWLGVGVVIGAIVGAVGVAVVSTLVLRAMDEWNSLPKERRDASNKRGRPS